MSVHIWERTVCNSVNIQLTRHQSSLLAWATILLLVWHSYFQHRHTRRLFGFCRYSTPWMAFQHYGREPKLWNSNRTRMSGTICLVGKSAWTRRIQYAKLSGFTVDLPVACQQFAFIIPTTPPRKHCTDATTDRLTVQPHRQSKRIVQHVNQSVRILPQPSWQPGGGFDDIYVLSYTATLR